MKKNKSDFEKLLDKACNAYTEKDKKIKNESKQSKNKKEITSKINK